MPVKQNLVDNYWLLKFTLIVNDLNTLYCLLPMCLAACLLAIIIY